MKQIISNHIAIVGNDIIEHPTNIYTKDHIEVVTFETHEQLNTHVSQQPATNFPLLPEVGEWCEKRLYQYGEKIAKCLQPHNRMHYALEDTPALWFVINPAAGIREWSSYQSWEFQQMDLGTPVMDLGIVYYLINQGQGHRQPSGQWGHFGWSTTAP